MGRDGPLASKTTFVSREGLVHGVSSHLQTGQNLTWWAQGPLEVQDTKQAAEVLELWQASSRRVGVHHSVSLGRLELDVRTVQDTGHHSSSRDVETSRRPPVLRGKER